MMQDINLIPEELKNQKKKEGWLKKLFIGSMVFLFVSILLSGSLLVYKVALDGSLGDINSKNAVEEQKIASLKAAESKMSNLGEKLLFIQKVLDLRLGYSFLLKELGNILPSGVYLTNVTAASEDKAAIGGITSSYAMLSELVKNISDNASLESSIFDYSEVTSVNLKEEADRIEFSMNVYLKKGALLYGTKAK